MIWDPEQRQTNDLNETHLEKIHIINTSIQNENEVRSSYVHLYPDFQSVLGLQFHLSDLVLPKKDTKG